MTRQTLLLTMMTALFRFILLVTMASADPSAAPEFCACRYDGHDFEGCGSYSRNTDLEGLVEWPTASDPCLGALNIEERVLPMDQYLNLCPNPNDVDVGYAEFIRLLREEPTHPLSLQVAQRYADLGLFNLTDGGTAYRLPETLVTGTKSVLSCRRSPNLCWAQVRVGLQGRSRRIGQICAQLHQQQTMGLLAEQAMARLLLCRDTRLADSVHPLCLDLDFAINEVRPTNATLCQGYGTVVPIDEFPVCQAQLDAQLREEEELSGFVPSSSALASSWRGSAISMMSHISLPALFVLAFYCM